jgi:ELWxxDGT repeat protein
MNFMKPPSRASGSRGTASPVTDGERVIATFASAGVVCYDFNGKELWKSDGTAAGTVLVNDIFPGWNCYFSCYYPFSSSPSSLTNVNGTLFFTANDGTNGRELWMSDGTAAGTVLVKDIIPGGAFSNPSTLTNVNGTLFFTVDNGTTGWELWKSNGTASGTGLVKDIYLGSASSAPLYLTNVNGTLFFTADDGTGVRNLWQSDGTAAGTVVVTNLVPNSLPNSLTNVNGTLFFLADDGTSGRELWRNAIVTLSMIPMRPTPNLR